MMHEKAIKQRKKARRRMAEKSFGNGCHWRKNHIGHG